jgi:hypothetical protein
LKCENAVFYDVQFILKAEKSILLCKNGRVAVLEYISLYIIMKMGVKYIVKVLGQ